MRSQAFMKSKPDASDAEIQTTLETNLCRCGTHMRILKAVKRARELMKTAAMAPASGERKV